MSLTTTQSAKPTLLVRLADWSYRRRRRVLLLWIVVLFATVFGAGAFGGSYHFTFTTPGSDSKKAQDLLERGFAARAGDDVNVVFQTQQGKTVDDPAVQAAIGDILDQFGKQPHVSAVVSPYTDEGARQIAPDHAPSRTARFASTRPCRTTRRPTARRSSPCARSWTVPTSKWSCRASRSRVRSRATSALKGIGLLVAALILLVSFGSLLAMGLPILIAVVGLGIGLSLVTLLANVLEVPDFAPQVAAMIGIGVGIDYVLFIVTRYRAALHSGLEPRAAVITSITTSGRAVIFAGCTVIISLLGLFVMNLGFLRGLAVGAVFAVLVVMLASVTLLPAMLGFIGHKIDRLRAVREPQGDR